MRDYPSGVENQIEWFHAIADRLGEQDPGASEEAQRLLPRFVADHLPGHAVPPDLDARAVRLAVVELRRNEQAWNRTLQSAIVRAHDLARAEGAPAARAELRTFRESCPWAYLRNVADRQASAYTDGDDGA